MVSCGVGSLRWHLSVGRAWAPCVRICDSGAASWALVDLASTVVERANFARGAHGQLRRGLFTVALVGRVSMGSLRSRL